MAFKIDEATPYFSSGPASFKIVSAEEKIANNKQRSIYLKLDLEVTDQAGKNGTLKDCIFSNKPKKYDMFLKSINRSELLKESVPTSVFIGQTGMMAIGVNDNGYSCVDDYIPSDDRSVDGWKPEKKSNEFKAGLPKGVKDDWSDFKVTAAAEVELDDIPFEDVKMFLDDKKPKSEARLRYEKVRDAKVKKHVRALDREVEALMRQFGDGWLR